jgi:hypothetical protein
MLTAAALIAFAACAPAAEEPDAIAADSLVDVEQTATATATCAPSDRMALEGRASPYDSMTFMIDGAEAKVCYGRPSVRERVVFGDLVPYDTLWRTGANEPTIIHLPVAAEIAGIAVDEGSYSIYTVPGEGEWDVVVNRSTSQWGHESQYNEGVRGEEIERATVPASQSAAPVEMFTITSESAGDGVDLVLEWANTRVEIPVRPTP